MATVACQKTLRGIDKHPDISIIGANSDCPLSENYKETYKLLYT